MAGKFHRYTRQQMRKGKCGYRVAARHRSHFRERPPSDAGIQRRTLQPRTGRSGRARTCGSIVISAASERGCRGGSPSMKGNGHRGRPDTVHFFLNGPPRTRASSDGRLQPRTGRSGRARTLRLHVISAASSVRAVGGSPSCIDRISRRFASHFSAGWIPASRPSLPPRAHPWNVS